jgi:pyruvate formate lyase activating enzyme
MTLAQLVHPSQINQFTGSNKEDKGKTSRYVIVPGLTDNPQDVTSMAQLVKTLNTVERIDLLPYHALGAHKWDLLGLDYKLHETQPPSSQQMTELAQLVHSITNKPVYWQ